MNYLVTLHQILSKDKKLVMYMRHYLLYLCLAAVVVFASCNGFRSGGQGEDALADSLAADSLAADSLEEDFSQIVVPKAADVLFDDFIFNFAGNRKLQKERIVFPLPVHVNGKKSVIEKKDWKILHFFMHQGYYTLLFDSEQHMDIVNDTLVNRAIVEKILFDRQSVRQFIFNRIRGAWMLTQIVEFPLEQSHNATFLAFYHQFASDASFQAKHLEPTVAFIGPDPDDDFAQMEGIITPDTWEAFAPHLPSKMLYNIVYGRQEQEGKRKLFVLRGIANGFELQMTFRRRGDNWRLSKLTT